LISRIELRQTHVPSKGFISLIVELRGNEKRLPPALVLWSQTVEGGQWIQDYEFVFPPWQFGLAIEGIRSVHQQLGGFKIDTDEAVDALGESFRAQREAAEIISNKHLSPLEPEMLLEELEISGFRRLSTQSEYDLRNIASLFAMAHGANFSVPGAGKTNALLALHTLEARRRPNLKLLVVCPKNAMISWDDEIRECLGEDAKFVRLTGGKTMISKLLECSPKYALISYQQLQTSAPQILQYLNQQQVHLTLDESHRIKAGKSSLQGQAAIRLAPFATRRDILSGTPMPQGLTDIASQFEFLWPKMRLAAELDLQSDEKRRLEVAREKIQPFYVRTTKPELGILPPDVKPVNVKMTSDEAEVYNLLRSYTARHLAGLDMADKAIYRKFGASLMRLLQFSSYPALLGHALERLGNSSDLMLRIERISSKPSSKLIKLDALVEEILKSQGEKVVIWTTFLGSIEMLEQRYAFLGATSIHGGVATGDEEESDTREGRIRRFHNDDGCRVLVANPAACGEGISLHKAARNAIYLDRSFNAAHFLQSIDRINRRGLPEGVVTKVRILNLEKTIDEVVAKRLKLKVNALEEILSDSSLSAMVYDPEDIEELGGDEFSLDEQDLQDVRMHLGV
jgi:SNF2 family DNA or RNA helicase